MTTRPATVPYTANDGTEIRNRYWSGADDTTDLVVMLPGLGYTLDGALLRYTAQAAAQRGADVFGIEYPFQAAGPALTGVRPWNCWRISTGRWRRTPVAGTISAWCSLASRWGRGWRGRFKIAYRRLSGGCC
jgi:hypothetical protein